MDDPLLARARLLVKIGEDAQAASTAVSESLTKSGMTAPTKTSPVVSPNRKSNAATSSATSYIDSPTHKRYEPGERSGSPESRGSTSVAATASGVTRLKVSVIRGSSLVSCLSGGDVRTLLKRGSIVEIEGVEYNLSKKVGSELSGNRIELERDYAGETKLNAFMSVKNTAKRSPKKVKSIEPIPSSEISDALRGLEDIIPVSMRREGEAAAGASMGDVRRANMAKSMNLHAAKEKSYLSAMDTGNSTAIGSYSGPNYETRVPSALSTSPPRFPVSKMTGHASPPKLSAMDEPVDRDAVAYQNYTEKYSAQARSTHLESQRKAAMARANRRMKREVEERTRKEEHELKLKEAKKQAMERKAKELRERTKQRVAKLTAEKKQQNDEKQAKEQWEEERKKHSQAAAKSEAYKDKMVALRKETAERLRKKELRDQANKMKAQLEMQKKLTEISLSRRNHDQRAPASFGSIHPIRSRNDSSSVVSGASRTSQAAMKARGGPGGERKSRTASPSTVRRRPRPEGNDRYSIDDTDFAGQDDYVAAQPVYVSPEKSASGSPAWMPQEEEEEEGQRQPSAIAERRSGHRDHGTPSASLKSPPPAPVSVPVPVEKPPLWGAGANSTGTNVAAGEDEDDAEWSDDSLGDEDDTPPVVPASADAVEPLGAPRASAEADRGYMGGRSRVRPVIIDTTRGAPNQSLDEISAITLGSALSPGRGHKPGGGGLQSSSRYSSRAPASSAVSVGTKGTKKSTFKPLKPITITRDFVPVPAEGEGFTNR